MQPVDILIIGAGAAGLTAAHFAGLAAAGSGKSIVLLDGAKKPGAKILVSGGGRCNVTNERVTENDFSGGSRATIRRVLRRFDERRTIEWMSGLGVRLKLEPTGKYFPDSDKARTVLNALLRGVEGAGAELRPASRTLELRRDADGLFTVAVRDAGTVRARRVILATGGLSLPKSGSDGWGLDTARALGHTIVPTTPALSPLVLLPGEDVAGRFAEFSGVTLDARLSLMDANGKVLASWTDSTLFTHFGLSGPAPLNISRHFLRARLENPSGGHRIVFGVPGLKNAAEADAWLQREAAAHGKKQTASALEEHLPERLAREWAAGTGKLAELSRDQRRQLATRLAETPLPVNGDRGYSFAETTAGGVDLSEVNTGTMESRVVPGLYLCGEMLDVDGRIGGFNFQWAWASGFLAGQAAAKD